MVGAWRSLVAHLVWDQGVASSNLAAPTSFPKIVDLTGAARLASDLDAVFLSERADRAVPHVIGYPVVGPALG